jgi:hypothetical protein
VEDDLHIPDEVIEALEDLAIRTSQGSFVKMEDIKKLAQKRQAAKELDKSQAPKTVAQAREMAKEFLKDKGIGPSGPREPGRSIPASEPQPSSRT